jgi:hypothetical protein
MTSRYSGRRDDKKAVVAVKIAYERTINQQRIQGISAKAAAEDGRFWPTSDILHRRLKDRSAVAILQCRERASECVKQHHACIRHGHVGKTIPAKRIRI